MKYHISFDIEFKRNKEKGLYIAFEGIDGSGKDTQIALLKKYLEEKKQKVVVTREPSNNLVIGKLIRKILFGKIIIPSPSLQYLYSADRMNNQKSMILPGLKEGKIVLSSRCFWSAVPYGIVDREVENSKLNNSKTQLLVAHGILSMYHQFTIPDITFYLDISVSTSVDRLSKMKKVKDIYEKREKIEKVIKSYKLLLKEFPKEFVIINGEQKPERVFEDIVEYINRRLNKQIKK